MITGLILALSFFAHADSIENTMGAVVAVERVYDLNVDAITAHLDKNPEATSIRGSYVPVYPGTALLRVNGDAPGYEPCRTYTYENLEVLYCARSEGYFTSVKAAIGKTVSPGEALAAICGTIEEARKHKFSASVLKVAN